MKNSKTDQAHSSPFIGWNTLNLQVVDIAKRSNYIVKIIKPNHFTDS